MLINYTIWSSNLFFCIQFFSRVFHSLEFFRVQVFLVQVFQGPGFSESRFSRVRVQVLEVAVNRIIQKQFNFFCKLPKKISLVRLNSIKGATQWLIKNIFSKIFFYFLPLENHWKMVSRYYMLSFSSIEKLFGSVWKNCISKSSHKNEHNKVPWLKTGNYTIHNVFHALDLDFFRNNLAMLTPHVKLF